MSQLKTTSLSHKDNNTGTPNITMHPDGTTSIGLTYTGALKNQLINSAFDVRQRGNNFDQSSGTNGFFADRWLAAGDDGNWVAGLSETSAPLGLAQSYNLTVNTLRQAIELPGTGKNGPFVNGSQWTISFWANKDTFTSVDFTWRNGAQVGTNQVAAGQTTVASTGETSNGFTRYAGTFNISANPAQTNICLLVSLNCPTKTSTLISGIQLEPGPTASNLEFRFIGTELTLAQRYYESSDADAYGVQVLESGNTAKYATFFFKVTKRVQATCTVTGAGSSQSYDVLRRGKDSFTAETITGGNNTVRFTGYTADAEL